MTEHSSCILCGSSNIRPMPDFKKAFLCRCENCGLVFSKRIPSQEELNHHYKNYGIHNYLSPLTIKRYNELLDKFEPYRKTNRIFDVGCGIGYFLLEAKKRGWEVYGNEFSETSVEICIQKGIHVTRGALDPTHFEPNSFDVVTSFEVIEHINNPREDLFNFHRLLRNGGLVYITTPNFNSFLRYRLKEAYNVIGYPEHLTYYTSKTLRKIFANSGFKKLKTATTGLSLTRLKTSKGESAQKFISSESDDEKLRIKMDNVWYLGTAKYIINKLLTWAGTGDTIKGWFVKE